MRCSHQVQVQRHHAPDAGATLINAVSELHEAIGAAPYAPVSQRLVREFAASYLGIDLTCPIDDSVEDPADGEGEDADD